MHGLFFVHIMKTGGTTLAGFLREQFRARAAYPPLSDGMGAMTKHDPTALLELDEDALEELRLVAVHMPAWVADAVAPSFHTVTVLREPVARTVSHLRQIAGHPWAPSSVEAIWDTPAWRLRLADYQTRHFAEPAEPEALPEQDADDLQEALGSDLRPDSDVFRPFHAALTTAVPNPTPMRSADLRHAKRRLARFDVVGVTHALERAAARVASLLGTEAPDLGRANRTSEARPLPRSFLRRLEDDLTLDLELYAAARALS